MITAGKTDVIRFEKHSNSFSFLFVKKKEWKSEFFKQKQQLF